MFRAFSATRVVQRLFNGLEGAQSQGFLAGGHSRCLVTQSSQSRWQNTSANPSQVKDQSSREEANYRARVDLALSYRALDFLGFGEGVCNHLTLRAPSRVREDDVMLVVPYGLHWKEVTASSLVGVDFFSGELVEGTEKPNIAASCIHRPVHNARYPLDGSVAVMHTHQPFTTAIACMDDPEPFKVSATQNSMRFLNQIAYDFDYDGFANFDEEGERLAKIIGDKPLLLMGQHGVLSVAARACDALDNLYYLERAAQLQILVQSSGARMRSSPAHVVESVASDESIPSSALAFFQGLGRILSKDEPDYKS